MGKWQIRIGDPGGGGGGLLEGDQFAPEIIVGNEPAGDPAGTEPAPFRYISDAGDGLGIAQALAEANARADGAWVHIRGGTYDLTQATSPALPLPVAGTRVTGAGDATRLLQDTLDRRMFLLTNAGGTPTGRSPVIEDLTIDWQSAAVGASGTSLIDAFGSFGCLLRNVNVIKPTAAVENANETLTSLYRAGFGTRILNCRALNIDGNVNIRVACFDLAFFAASVQGSRCNGSNIPVRVASTSCEVAGCNLSGGGVFATAVGIEVSAAIASIMNNVCASLNDGIVAVSGAGASIVGNVLGAGMAGDGIRIEAGATDSIIVANRLNGNSITVSEPTADAAHNI